MLTTATFLAVLGATASATAGSSADTFLRVQKDSTGNARSMDTAIVRYEIPARKGAHGSAMVDLVAVVHVGERDYYAELNRRFQSYDAVLYELIAPEDSPLPPKPVPGAVPEKSVLSQIQGGIKDLLGLEFQLDGIDYRRPNMVHADLSPESFLESMRERGESVWTIAARLLLQGIADQQRNQDPVKDLRLIAVLLKGTQRERQVEFRRYLAENFNQLDEFVERLEGPKGSTIIAARNEKALEVLDKQLARGKKRIAIFYGAAHMPDMERRLKERFHAVPKDTQWLEAWSLLPSGAPEPAAPASAPVAESASPPA